MAGSNHQTRPFQGFPGGVNNVYREETVPDGQLRSAVNVDLLPGGKVRRRAGYLRRLALTDARSAVSHLGYIYLADGAELKQIDPTDFSEEVIGTVPAQAYLSYAVVNQYLYISSGDPDQAYRVDAAGNVTRWSAEQPLGPPTLTRLDMDSIPLGTYQAAYVFLRGREESGAPIAAKIEDTTGFTVNTPVAQSPETTAVRVYVTHSNGKVLYRYGDYPAGASVPIGRLPDGPQLETQFLEPIPAGHIVRSYNGQLYSAVGSRLFYSQAMRYGLCNRVQHYFDFPGRITMVRPVESGIYVAAGKRTVFLAGNRPEEMTLRTAHHAGAIEGTDTEIQAGAMSFENLSTGMVAIWWATTGVMVVGMANGQVQPIREGELALPEFSRGATMLREENGVRQIMSVLQNPKTPTSAFAARDEAVATVYRNGVEIP